MALILLLRQLFRLTLRPLLGLLGLQLFLGRQRRQAFRGPSGQPDLVEKPGIRLDVVVRQGIKLFGSEVEVKLEGRNLTNTRYQEFQRLNASRIDTNTYVLGRTFQASVSAKF